MAARPFQAWDVVAVTAQSVAQAKAFQAELSYRKALGALAGVGPHTIVMAVPDPHPQPANVWEGGTAVGSGGATLNAILGVTEQLSARRGTGTLDASVLQTHRILVLHTATSRCIPAVGGVGKAFCTLPAEIVSQEEAGQGTGGLVTNLDLVLHMMSRWVGDADAGVWVCSTEFFMAVPEKLAPIQWTNGITAVALPCDASVGAQHGVYKLSKSNRVESLSYQATELDLQENGFLNADGRALVTAPIVRFDADAAELLLGLYASSPLDGCTSYGYDAGGSAVPVNLYLDILGACCSKMTFEEYTTPPPTSSDMVDVFNSGARALIWKTFHLVELHAVVVNTSFSYVKSTQDYVEFLADGPLWSPGSLGECVRPSKNVHAQVQGSGVVVDPSAIAYNSVVSARVPYTGMRSSVKPVSSFLGAGCVIEHSKLFGCNVGDGAFVSGLDLTNGAMDIEPHTAVQQCRLIGGDTVVVTYGVHDDLFCAPPTTFCNYKWESCSAAKVDTVWSTSIPESKRSLFYAQIFVSKDGSPISLAECVAKADVHAELEWRRELGLSLDIDKMRSSLSVSRQVLPLYFCHGWFRSTVASHLSNGG